MRDLCIAYAGSDWRKEAEIARAEIKATLDSGEYTVDDWLLALQ